MTTRAVHLAAMSLAAVLGLSACGGGEGSSSGGDGLPDSIPVTMVGDMTGFGAQYGKSYQEGAEVAIDEINESDLLGGAELKLTVEDTGSDPKTASSAVSAATRSDAVAILGPTLSSEAVAAAPIAQQAKIPYLSDEASTGTQELGEWVYNMSPAQVNQAPLVARYIARSAKKVGIIYANDNPSMVDLQDALAAEVKKSGAEVSGLYGTPIAATDFTALATKAMSESPDAIGILGGGSMIPAVANQLRTAGFTGDLFANMGADGSLGSGGKAVEGFIYPTQWVPEVQSEESSAFVARYDKLFPDSTPIYTAMDGYESVKFLAMALAEAQSTDRDAVLNGLQTVAKTGFTSPSGDVTFTGKGGRLKVTPGIIVKYEGGKLLPQD
jgi:branched-chain amino acid transport system substrate-binding protein